MVQLSVLKVGLVEIRPLEMRVLEIDLAQIGAAKDRLFEMPPLRARACFTEPNFDSSIASAPSASKSGSTGVLEKRLTCYCVFAIHTRLPEFWPRKLCRVNGRDRSDFDCPSIPIAGPC
jgi:hypothetical protein